MRTTTTSRSPAAAGQIADDLRAARERAGLTRPELVRLAGCSISWLGATEAGAVPRRSPTLDHVRQVLADVESGQLEP